MNSQTFRCTCQVCGGIITVRTADGYDGLMRELSSRLICNARVPSHHAILGLHRIMDIELLDTFDNICYDPNSQKQGEHNGIH